MEWNFILVGLFAFLLLASFFLRGGDGKTYYRYQKRKALFSPAERSFLGVVDNAVGSEYRVLGKVRIADIIAPAKGMNRKNWQVAFNKISAKHFDYVLCDKATLAVIAVIELDDKSHKQKRSQARDQLIEQACDSANLPLVRFEAKRSYQIDDVKTKLFNVLQPTELKSSEQAARLVAHRP